MAFKNTWKPRVDGVDDADSSAVNEIAEEVIRQADEEKNIKQSVTKINEDVKTLQDDVDGLKKNPTTPTIDAYTKQEANNLFANAIWGEESREGGIEVDDLSPLNHRVDISVTAPNSLSPDVNIDETAGGLTVQTQDHYITIKGTTNGGEFMAGFVVASYRLQPGTYTLGYIAPSFSTVDLIGIDYEIKKSSNLSESHRLNFDINRTNNYLTKRFDEEMEVICNLRVHQDFSNPIIGTIIDTKVVPTIDIGNKQIVPVLNLEKIKVKRISAGGISTLLNDLDIEFHGNNPFTGEKEAYVGIQSSPSEDTVYTGLYVTDSRSYGHVYNLTYIKDTNRVVEELKTNISELGTTVGDVETALDTIIAQQESIIEIQNALIGGGNE